MHQMEASDDHKLAAEHGTRTVEATKLFIGNLSYSTSATALHSAFAGLPGFDFARVRSSQLQPAS